MKDGINAVNQIKTQINLLRALLKTCLTANLRLQCFKSTGIISFFLRSIKEDMSFVIHVGKSTMSVLAFMSKHDTKRASFIFYTAGIIKRHLCFFPMTRVC